jgi:hypothetical protein
MEELEDICGLTSSSAQLSLARLFSCVLPAGFFIIALFRFSTAGVGVVGLLVVVERRLACAPRFKAFLPLVTYCDAFFAYLF